LKAILNYNPAEYRVGLDAMLKAEKVWADLEEEKEAQDRCMVENNCDFCDFRGEDDGGPSCHTLS